MCGRMQHATLAFTGTCGSACQTSESLLAPCSAPFRYSRFPPGTKPTNEFSASQSRLTMTLCNFTSREDDRYGGMCGILVRLGRLAKNIAPAVLHCFALFCIVSRHHTILGSCGFLHTSPVTIYQKSLYLSL